MVENREEYVSGHLKIQNMEEMQYIRSTCDRLRVIGNTYLRKRKIYTGLFFKFITRFIRYIL